MYLGLEGEQLAEGQDQRRNSEGGQRFQLFGAAESAEQRQEEDADSTLCVHLRVLTAST